ncbi:MAG TPA: pyroglutamyl-peptidase I [Usitatibacter sp.]|jgi:pyroglutamyl-peptidase|nr:pyroglutamyl-peptidase I [Usitatibacter sp.]
MLRRRKRSLRGPRPAAGAAAQAPVPTRRRAREGANVPAELRIAAPSRGEGRQVVLVTGFEPFGGEKVNPSWDVCLQLPDEIAGLRVERLRLPCEFRSSIQAVAEAIERAHPSIVVCLGQAGGRARIGVERVAINVDDARIPDNAGAQPVDELVAANGPPAYFASLPVKAMAAAIRAAGAPAEVSNSAGTFVCNHVMYGVLHYLAASGSRARAGFIHVPFSEEQAIGKHDVPAMSLATMVKGVAAAIAAAHENRHDIHIAEGSLD